MRELASGGLLKDTSSTGEHRDATHISKRRLFVYWLLIFALLGALVIFGPGCISDRRSVLRDLMEYEKNGYDAGDNEILNEQGEAFFAAGPCIPSGSSCSPPFSGVNCCSGRCSPGNACL